MEDFANRSSRDTETPTPTPPDIEEESGVDRRDDTTDNGSSCNSFNTETSSLSSFSLEGTR